MGKGYGKTLSLPLPSGNKVRVKQVSLLSLVKLGQIPPQLISAVWSVFGQDNPGAVQSTAETDRVQTMVALMDQAVKAVLVDIKIVETETITEEDADGFMIGQVNLQDMPDTDKSVIFGFAQGVTSGDPIQQEVLKSLATFPGESASEAPGLGSETLRAAPKRDDPTLATESAGAVL